MTQWELFKKTMAHEQGEDFLFTMGFTPFLKQKVIDQLKLSQDVNLSEYFGTMAAVSVTPDPVFMGDPDFSYDFSPFYEGVENFNPVDIDRHGVLRRPCDTYHFTHTISPLRNCTSLKEIEDFPMLDMAPGFEEGMKDKVDQAHREGKVTVCTIGHLYETAWQIRGYEPFLMDMYLAPDNCHSILERMFIWKMKLATAAARAGVDYLHTGDDVANQETLMFRKDMWWEFIGNRWNKIYKAVKEINPGIKIWYHSDGNISDILDNLVEMGVDILNPVQPECMDTREILKRYGSNFVLHGCVGTQTTMPFGTPGDVTNRVLELKEMVHSTKGGAMIIAPTHVLEPEVTVENIVALAQACKSQ
jgi:uroporphyrinogen decarboxylase